MAGSTYSSNLKIELMATGENSGTWGDITNTNLGTALEQAIVGLGNPNYASDANLTISITNSNASQAARALVLNVTSAVSLTATRELVVPTIQKQYIVQNNTTGSQSITVKTSAGTGITVPNGRKAHLYVNGTDVIQMFDFINVSGGTINNTTIGATTASSGAFTTLTASGATTLNGAVALGDASGDLITVPGTINSNLLFTDNTYDIGASGATRPRNLFLAGAATIGGNLSVGGTLTLTGGVNLNGNVTVGDSSSDTLTINSTITSNLIFTDNTYDIGASGATRPRNLFIAGNITAGGNQTLTGSLTVDSTTDSSSTTTGSIQTDGGLGVAKAAYIGTTLNIGGLTSGRVAYVTTAGRLTDSANLTFDGTTLTTTTTSGIPLVVTGTGSVGARIVGGSGVGAGSYLSLQAQGGNAALIGTEASIVGSGTSTNLMLYGYGSNSIIMAPATAEVARFTSTGLGIGTSSPAYKVDTTVSTNGINGYNAYGANGGASEQIGYRAINANSTGIFAGVNGFNYSGGFGSANQAVLTSIGNVALQLGTNSTVRATLDTSGNLSLATNGTSFQWTNAGNNVAVNGTSGVLSFYTGTSSYAERARITSAGDWLVGYTTNTYLGSTPFRFLTYNSTGASIGAAGGSYTVAQQAQLYLSGGYGDGGTRVSGYFIRSQASGGGGNVNNDLLFVAQTNNGNSEAERARIDSSGRLLVGTTSSFGGAGQFAIDQSGGGIPAIHLIGTQGVGGGAREIGATFSAVTNDTGPAYGNVAKISAAKENATQGDTAGYMAFQTTPNGGSLTERARITSTGKFGIGNSTPQYTLDVNSSARIAGGAATFYMDSTYSTGQSYRWIVPDNTYGAPFGSLALYSDTQGAYRLVMSSAGNLGIGITAPSARLHVYQDSSSTSVMSGAYIQNVSSTNNTQAGIGFFAYDNYNAKIYTTRTGSSQGNIIFATNSGGGITEGFVGERARITHEGRFLINTSSTLSGSAYLQALGGPYPIWSQGSDTGYTQGAIVCASGTDSGPSGRGIGVYMWNQTSTATWYMGTAYGSGDTWFVMRKTGSGFSPDAADVALGWKMQLTSGGVAYQGNNSSAWSTTSDARIKDDIQTIENGLDVVLALRPVDFYNKVTKKREENFIAQEYEQVLAKHVTREKPIGAEQEFVTDEILRLNPNLVPYLVSAIQKLSAEIEALKATRN